MDTIDHRLLTSDARQHAELTPTTGPYELLASDSRVVNMRRFLNVIIGTETSLVRGAETPAVSLAIFRNRNGVITACGAEDGVNAGNLRGRREDARAAVGVVDEIVFREGSNV